MTVSVDDIRIKVHDYSEPYTYSNDEINAALADAIDWLDIQTVSMSCPKYDTLQKLVAARYLVESQGASRSTNTSQLSSFTEGEKSVSFAAPAAADTTQAQLQGLTTEIEQYLDYCKHGNAKHLAGGIGILHDNY